MTDERNRNEPGADTDAAVTEVYRATKDERAPEALNRAILDQAAKAAQPRYSRVRLWTRPMAWAATAMLSVAIVLQLTQAPAPNGIGFDDGSYETDAAVATPADQPEETTDTVRKTEALGSSAKQVAPAALSEARQREQQSKATTVDQDILQRVDGMARMREGEIQEAVAADESAQAGAAIADSLRAVSASFSSDRCDEIATATPEAWLQCITSLEDAGLTDAAAEQRKLLAAAFPDFNIP